MTRPVVFPKIVKAGETEVCFRVENAFRVQKIVAFDLPAPELAWLEAAWMGSDPDSQLLQPVDLWLFSSIYEQQLQAAFLAEHGLTGKTPDEIDDFLDERGWSMPTSIVVMLPPLEKGEQMRLQLRCTVDVKLAVCGLSA